MVFALLVSYHILGEQKVDTLVKIPLDRIENQAYSRLPVAVLTGTGTDEGEGEDGGDTGFESSGSGLSRS